MKEKAQNSPIASETPPSLSKVDSPLQGALSRRGFLRAAGIATVGAGLSACVGAKSAPSASAGRKVQLVYQDFRTDWFPGMAQKMLEEFHATHPNIRVFYNPDPENLEDAMLADMQAGTAPDVFQGCCAHFPIWAQKGYTLDLRPYVKADLDAETINDWDQAQYQSFFTRDGRQYGLPKYHGALALYYNKDLFDQYRVDYPNGSWTFDAYLAAMKLLTKDADRDGRTDLWGSMLDVSWDRLQVHVNSWGGHLVDRSDPRKCRMGETEALRAFQWIYDRMWTDRVMPRVQDVQKMGTRQAFVAGKVAMTEDGSWALKDILNSAKFRVGVAPFPAGPFRRVTLATTDGFGIYSATRNPDAAWELMKFLISKDYGRAMAKASFLQPARASLLEEWVAFIRDEYPQQAKEMDLAAFADGHIKGYSVVAEVFENMAEARQIALTAWEKIYTLGQLPVEAMKTVCQQIQSAQLSERGGGQACC